jgi:hypothetical protein
LGLNIEEILNNNIIEEGEMIITEENQVENGVEEEFNISNYREGDKVEEYGDFGIDDKEEEIGNDESQEIMDMSQEKENDEPPKRYNLRPNQTPNYSHRFALLSVHAGVRKWGEKAREAIRDELKMLKKENVFEEISNPSTEQMKKALMIHCFMVEKRDGRIKARAVADGRSQIRYTEEETYSPMVKLESIMLNAFIDAHEGRYVATVDIKGAFLKAKVPNNMELIVKMTGELAQIMC